MKAAIYCRVSIEDQEKEGTSLQTQLDACITYPCTNIVMYVKSDVYLHYKADTEKSKLDTHLVEVK